MAQQIPVTNSPQQTFSVSLQVDGKNLILRLGITFCEMAQYWLLSIADAGGTSLVQGIPMLTGDYPASNLLAQYGYLAVGSCYVISIGNTMHENPGPNDWGGQFVLLWGDTAR